MRLSVCVASDISDVACARSREDLGFTDRWVADRAGLTQIILLPPLAVKEKVLEDMMRANLLP